MANADLRDANFVQVNVDVAKVSRIILLDTNNLDRKSPSSVESLPCLLSSFIVLEQKSMSSEAPILTN